MSLDAAPHAPFAAFCIGLSGARRECRRVSSGSPEGDSTVRFASRVGSSIQSILAPECDILGLAGIGAAEVGLPPPPPMAFPSQDSRADPPVLSQRAAVAAAVVAAAVGRPACGHGGGYAVAHMRRSADARRLSHR